MSTTMIIVEFLIIGFQVMVWVALLLWPRIYPNCIDWAKSENCTPVLVMIVVATAYTLGSVFDRFLGHLLSLIKAIWKPEPPKARFGVLAEAMWKTSDPPKDPCENLTGVLSLEALKQRALLKYPHYLPYVENSHRRRRLVRATLLNSLIALGVVIFKYRSHWRVAMWSLLPLAIACGLAWRLSAWRYGLFWKDTLAAYGSLEGKRGDGRTDTHEVPSGEQAPGPPQAAGTDANE